jgi:catechol 2,3-dioxygenase-like lactoylglutathione lyase family enzyme
MGSTVPGMTEIGTDWRVVDGVATAWFDASSLIEGAALAGRIVELSAEFAIDLRAKGVRVRLDSDEHAEAVSAAARDLGLAANPAVLQHFSVVFDSANPSVVRAFWQRVLDYTPGEDGGLADPLRRDPAIRIRPSTEPRPLRNRIHLDVVRPAAAVEQADLGAASGPFGVRHSDPEGNEVDLVPGAALGEEIGTAGTADWQAVFSAMACYRITSPTQQCDLAAAAAALADDAGFPLMVDLRPGLVIIDSGKDQWVGDAHGLELDFADLAGNLETAARKLGATADPGLPRFAQLFLDAADVAAARAFWVAALGYTYDRRAWVSDIHDPRRLNPVLVFQEIDASETERRRQRNRIHFELAVPSDLAPTRLATIVAAGGRLLDESEDRWRVADPEGNEMVLVSGA